MLPAFWNLTAMINTSVFLKARNIQCWEYKSLFLVHRRMIYPGDHDLLHKSVTHRKLYVGFLPSVESNTFVNSNLATFPLAIWASDSNRAPQFYEKYHSGPLTKAYTFSLLIQSQDSSCSVIR